MGGTYARHGESLTGYLLGSVIPREESTCQCRVRLEVAPKVNRDRWRVEGDRHDRSSDSVCQGRTTVAGWRPPKAATQIDLHPGASSAA